MDKKTVLLPSACTLLMISCSNDSELINVAETTGLQTKAFVGEADFQIVDYAGDKCIQFKNDSVFNAMLWEMNDMSEEEINNIFSGVGFVSQWQLMQEADQEQELIVDNYEKDLSQPWPAHQIKEFKQKYDDVFMFEPYDSTDFIAHYKLKGSTYSPFVNRQGLFLIGDSVVHASVYESLEEYFGPGISLYGDDMSTSEATSTNKAEVKYTKSDGTFVKVRAMPALEDGTMWIAGKEYKKVKCELLSQRKRVLWKRHHASVHFRYQLKGSGLGFGAPAPQGGYFISHDNQVILNIVDPYGKETYNLGVFGKNDRYGNGVPMWSLSGRMEIWSDEIPESKRGTSKVDFQI